jgi:23S rRNA pseudouridine2605 synthase
VRDRDAPRKPPMAQQQEETTKRRTLPSTVAKPGAATRITQPPRPARSVRMRADGSAAVRGRAAKTTDRLVRPPKVELASDRADGLHRIAKLLARAGVASRRDIERMIEEGRVALNGQPVTTPATLLADVQGITVDGKPVAAPEAARLYLFHKPSGTLTAARDFSGRRTIYDVLPPDLPRLIPVGRLDLNTEGLLLLTTDGALKRQLELPSSGVERTYRARAFGDVTQAQLEDLAEGVTIEGMRYGRIDANMERRTGRNVWIEMTLTEGKNREVRRVLEYLGLRVARLIRTRYGPFVLGSSAPGQVEEAASREVEQLLRLLK